MTPLSTNARLATAGTATTMIASGHLTMVVMTVRDSRKQAFWDALVDEALAEPDAEPTFQSADEFLSWLSEQ
jgi:hypothetical protein